MKIIPLLSAFLLYFQTLFGQWTTINQLPLNELGTYPSISAPDCSTIAVSGGVFNSPRVFLSTNGGINFTNITSNITQNELYCIYALNKDTIFTGDGGGPGGIGGNAKIYKTVNGGMNWSVVLSTGGNSGFISGIAFSRQQPDFGIIVSDPALNNDSFWIAKTHDRGKTWQIKKAPNAAPYTTQNSVFVIDSLFYGFGLNSTPAKFYLTTNGGANWSVRNISLTGNSIPSISFNENKLDGIAVSDLTMPVISVTSNGGLNWSQVNTGTGMTGIGTVKWVPGSPIYFLAASNIKRSSDNGVTWHLTDAGGVTNFSHMDLHTTGANSICAFALASNGKILKFEGEPFGIDPENTTVPKEWMLHQNYPNPFNPETIIKYTIPKSGNVKLTVYNINGIELFTVINRYHQSGNYSEAIKMDNYPSGIYLYELNSESFKQSRKMVLVK